MPCATPNTSVQDFYSNGKIFITGVTGFLGKSLLEKLLRVCPDVDQIYVLVRVKKGKDPHLRLKELFQDPIFSVIRKERPGFEKKITCIFGDICRPRMDMSDDDYQFLTKEVTHVIHSAATVRFNEQLKTAIQINIFGTKEMLTFCQNCIQLKIFVYVSTAYAHCTRTYIKEEFYETPISGEDAIALNKIFDEDKLEELTPALIKPWPNTYAFTKAVCENIVKDMGTTFPAIIFRPSIVMGTAKEPLAGWVDNYYGPMGFIFAVGVGVLRVLPFDGAAKANLVPVDRVVNALLCCASDEGNRYKKNAALENSLDTPSSEIRKTLPKIFNFVSTVDNTITWGEFSKMSIMHGLRHPSQKSIWYYTIVLAKIKPLYLLFLFFLHYIPGAFIDGILILLRKKPKLIKTYNKIYGLTEIIKTFGLKSWIFTNDNTKNIWSQLSDKDKNLFDFDMQNLNWDQYFNDIILGMRLYLFHEPEDTLPAARRRMFFFWLAHRFVQFTVLTFCFWILSKLYVAFKGFSEAPFEESILTKPESLMNST